MIKRRRAIQAGATLAVGQALGLQARAEGHAEQTAEQPSPSTQGGPAIITRPIPSSGERVPVIGMGTSRTFDTPGDPETLSSLTGVMRAFLDGGGTIIDSSPMYGEAESRVGDVLRAMPERPALFEATKVWTTGRDEGIQQMEQSARRMDVERFDLIAVHNLRDWTVHMKTLKRWKAEGRVRYIGITTSHGRSHAEFLKVMRNEPIDFVQFSYNIEDRVAERELLPTAQEHGIATMINRPYQRGSLFGQTRGAELPAVAAELGCESWGQFFLKFILAHPAVTCIIPATSKARHMSDNMGANVGPVPTADQRDEMLSAFAALKDRA